MNELIERLDKEFRARDVGWSLGSLGTDRYVLELGAWKIEGFPMMWIEGCDPETMISIASRYVGLLNDPSMRESYRMISKASEGLFLKRISILFFGELMYLGWYDGTGRTKERAQWKLTTDGPEFVALETYKS